jgi:CheY-like chemotaxis protein
VTDHSRPVLIVDDDDDIVDMLDLVLSSAGYQVETASNGKAALQKLRSRSPLPGLVILDLMMPVMTGWDFRAEQVKDPDLARVPVVCLSGAGNAGRRAASMGMSECLDKPVDAATLLEVVQRHYRTPAN